MMTTQIELTVTNGDGVRVLRAIETVDGSRRDYTCDDLGQPMTIYSVGDRKGCLLHWAGCCGCEVARIHVLAAAVK